MIDLSECRLQEAFFAATDQRYTPSPLHRTSDPGNRCHPDFAAPELSRGGRKSAATDVYALGVVLFILLTGRRSGAKAIRDIFEAGEREEAGERLQELLVSLAPELEDTFLAASLADDLAPEPERRTATMAGILDMLRIEAQALRDLRTPANALYPPRRVPAANPAPVHAPTTPPVSRWPALRPWAIAVTVLGVVAATAWLSLDPPQHPPDPPTPEPEHRVNAPSSPPAGSPETTQILVRSSGSTALPEAPTREQVTAALLARLPEIARCPGVPERLTLAIDVGPTIELAELQLAEVDPTRPLDKCILGLVSTLAVPTSAATSRHVVTLSVKA